MNKNTVATIGHNENKDVLLNKKCLRLSMNRSYNKKTRVETYEISKMFLSCFDCKVYVLGNGIDALATCT